MLVCESVGDSATYKAVGNQICFFSEGKCTGFDTGMSSVHLLSFVCIWAHSQHSAYTPALCWPSQTGVHMVWSAWSHFYKSSAPWMLKIPDCTKMLDKWEQCVLRIVRSLPSRQSSFGCSDGPHWCLPRGTGYSCSFQHPGSWLCWSEPASARYLLNTGCSEAPA